jgi:hypothetical protein
MLCYARIDARPHAISTSRGPPGHFQHFPFPMHCLPIFSPFGRMFCIFLFFVQFFPTVSPFFFRFLDFLSFFVRFFGMFVFADFWARYSVIPLAPNVGLIEWMPNCDTMHALIKEYRDSRRLLLNIEHRLMTQMAPDYTKLTLMQKIEVRSGHRHGPSSLPA